MSEVPENILHSHTITITIAANGTHHRRNPALINDTSNTIRTMVISVLSVLSVVGAMSTDPKTPANAQCAVESGGLAAFLRDTAAERARDVHAFQEAALSEIHRHTGFDVDDTDRSTSANQVPVSVLTCSGRSNPSSSTPVPPADHAQGVTIRSHATNIFDLLASAHVRSSGFAGASDETGAAATEDHATNQRSDVRPRQAHITARTRASEPSSERECRTSGVRVSPDDAETRSHGRDVRSRRENSESQPGGPVRWTHPMETTGCSLARSSLQVGRKCAGEPTGRRATPADGRDGRSTSSAEQRLEGSSLLPSQVQGRSRAGHRSVDLRPFSTATTNRGLVDSPRSQDTGTSTGSPAGRLCSQNQGGQAGATAGLWDSTRQHQEPEENPQTQGPDGGRGRLCAT